MFFQDIRERVKEALDIVVERADGVVAEGRTAIDIVTDVARYARGRLREQYRGEPSDPVVVVVNAFIIEAGNELIEGKRATAMAIADEKLLARQAEMEHRNAQEWEKRAQQAARDNNEVLEREALERKREHDEIVEILRAQWKSQRALVDDLKTSLRRLNQVIEQAKRTKDRLRTHRFVRRADELKKQAQRMDQIVKGLDLLAQFDRSSRPVNSELPTDG